MRAPIWIILGSLGPLLAACGGAGENVASVPPPPVPATPTAPSTSATTTPPAGTATVTVHPSPATRAETYDMIALVDQGDPVLGSSTNRLAGLGEVKITTYQPTGTAGELSYTLEFATAALPGGGSALTAVFPSTVMDTPVGQIALKFGDAFGFTGPDVSGGGGYLQGSSQLASTSLSGGKTLNSQLGYSTGLDYVSLGQWNWWITDNATGNREEYNSVYFVHGDRTLSSDIPVFGTATYIGQSLGLSTDAVDRGSAYGAPIDVSLTADFGQRSIAAQLSRAYWSGGDAIGGYTSVAAVDVHGAGTIAAPGTFGIPLTGTVDTTPVTGSLDGAFFGPGAQEVGGVFAVGTNTGQSMVRDAFVAAQPVNW